MCSLQFAESTFTLTIHQFATRTAVAYTPLIKSRDLYTTPVSQTNFSSQIAHIYLFFFEHVSI